MEESSMAADKCQCFLLCPPAFFAVDGQFFGICFPEEK